MGIKNKPCKGTTDPLREHHWTTIDEVYGRDKFGKILTRQVTICSKCGGRP
jgi:hypothetical protein